MDLLDGVGLRHREQIVTSLERPAVIGKPLSAEILLVAFEGLDHSPHSPVEHKDPFGEQLPKYFLSFAHCYFFRTARHASGHARLRSRPYAKAVGRSDRRDLVLVMVQVLARLNDDLVVDLTFQVIQTMVLFVIEKVGDLRMEPYHDPLTILQVGLLFFNGPQDLVGNRHVGFDPTPTFTVRTRAQKHIFQTFPRALARHLHQTQLGNLQDVGPSLVSLDRLS